MNENVVMLRRGTRRTPVDLGEWPHNTREAPGNLAEDGDLAPPDKEVAMGTILPPAEGPDNAPRRGNVRDRWRREVYRSTAITDSTRVLLLLMSEDMDGRGYVSVPRAQLAERLDRNERKVSARLEQAVTARLLDRVVRGNKGRTAVYRAMLPDLQRLPVSSTLTESKAAGSQHPVESENRHPLGGDSGPPGGPASSKRDRSLTGERGRAAHRSTSELLSEKKEVQAAHAGTSRLRLVESLRDLFPNIEEATA